MRTEIEGMTEHPYFSIVISTYNRSDLVRRCIDSCLGQTFDDLEVVVVDDCSEDDTLKTLATYTDPRLRVFAHDVNRGMDPARHTGSTNARGEWILIVDSDDELVEGALDRLHEVIGELPEEVKVIRSRLLRDDGSVTPPDGLVPAGPFGYEGRIRWEELVPDDDAGRCIHHSILALTPFVPDRRGCMDTLFELDVARLQTSVCISDVLGKVHYDAPNSFLREVSFQALADRLVREAPDMLWMSETALARHGEALRRFGPQQYLYLLRRAATQSLLLGKKRKGLRYAVTAIRWKPSDPFSWVILAVGLFGSSGVLAGAYAQRRVGSLLEARAESAPFSVPVGERTEPATCSTP